MEKKSVNTSCLKKPSQNSTPKEWKEWKAKRKATKRKRREEKLIRQIEKRERLTNKPNIVTASDIGTNDGTESNEGRSYTLSIALPGSILDNAQSPELRTYLAGQIARAAVVFNVDEIVIFDETGADDKTVEGEFTGVGKKGQGNVQMARILQFLECPQYLRKSFFPMHKDLKYAGLLNPLDCPHHMRVGDESSYREGVIVDQPAKTGRGSYCDVGLAHNVQVDKRIQPGVRVTVKMLLNQDSNSKKRKGLVVAPSMPRTHLGLYWGYSVRLAPNFSSVFTESPYEGGYDVTIGTSERGECVDELSLDKFSHLLVVFGGVQGLESALAADEKLTIDEPSVLFDHYINTCPQQGSRTIRTEEAILITLSALRPKIAGITMAGS